MKNYKQLVWVGLLVLLLSLALIGAAATRGYIRVSEVDGSPNLNLARYLKFPNGSLTLSGDTITVGAGGSWILTGAEGADAFLTLAADESDDNGDDWRIESDATTNALIFLNDTSGSQVAKLTLSTAGVLTLSDSETLTNASDVTTLAADDGAASFVIKGFEASDSSITLQADEGDDTLDSWKIESDVTTNHLIVTNSFGGIQMELYPTGGMDLSGDSSNIYFNDLEDLDNSIIRSKATVNAFNSFSILGDGTTYWGSGAAAEDTILYRSSAGGMTFQAEASLSMAVTLLGDEAATAVLKLFADDDDDATDGWFFTATTAGTLTIGNDSSAAGTAVTKITVAGSDGDMTLTGGIVGDGGDQLVGFLNTLVTSTTTTLTAAQCGSTIVNDSADVLTLPEASTVPGCRYTFVVNNASNLDINPFDTTDIILPFVNAIATDPTVISPSAGDAIRCATVGGSITLQAVSADNWAVVGGVAGQIWSDIN